LKWAPARGWWRQLVFGACLAVGMTAGSVALALGSLSLAQGLPLLHVLLSVFLLKASFALRELLEAARGVEEAVGRGDLAAARAALRALCSRDPAALDGE